MTDLRTSEGQERSSPNVLFIVVDTLAANYLGAYNSNSKNSPNIDQIAHEGVTFKRAYATSSWTKPSIASMFTSQYPAQHGVTSIKTHFQPLQPVLSDVLAGNGYATFGVVSHTLIAPKFGYNKGFQKYSMVKLKQNVHDSISSDLVTNQAIAVLEHQLKEVPAQSFFLFCHYFDPHYDYQHHPELNYTSDYAGEVRPGTDIRVLREKLDQLKSEDKEFLKNLYREEIAYTDQQIGKLLDFLKKSNLDTSTLVVLVADHGEEFFEHGWLGHTRTLYEELVHVPFIMKGPRLVSNRVIDRPVSTIDIMPTILEYIGSSYSDPSIQGISLVPWITSVAGTPPSRDLFFEVDFKSEAIDASKIAVIRGNQKLIRDRKTGDTEFIDLAMNPQELEQSEVVESSERTELNEALNQFQRRWSKNSPENRFKKTKNDLTTTPKEIEQLKTLGYL